MPSQRSILTWNEITAEEWSYHRASNYLGYVLFELTKLPNFSEPRFRELGEQTAERKGEVARRQLQMLRQLHSLGPDYAFALRIYRHGAQLRIFVVVRVASRQPVLPHHLEDLSHRIQRVFPKEYSLTRVAPYADGEHLHAAIDPSWARYVEELIKPEDDHAGNEGVSFYVASLWNPLGLNDMEGVCRALQQFNGQAMLDITLIPSSLHAAERGWVDLCVRRMRDAQTGERLKNPDGKILKTYEPIPSLRAPVENYEDWLRRYNSSNRLFLYAIRIFSSEPPHGITQALVANATQTAPQVLSLDANNPLLPAELSASGSVDVLPEAHSPSWNGEQKRPFRAQRLHRLVDLDEIASFWRFPIPIHANFPGFELDIGIKQPKNRKPSQISHRIKLGSFTDGHVGETALATFDRENLTKHGLIVGVSGSGKTTAMFDLLHQIWNPAESDERIPFIVLEPAKTEYRALKTIEPFNDDLLIFTLGDERLSPFRFNPFEVPTGIPLERHISRLNACFIGAFNLFDPLPLLLDKAIRESYQKKDWFDDIVGGETDLEVPTLSDLCQEAEHVIEQSGYSEKLRDDFNAALLQRLDSLRRGSKGRMLDTGKSIPFDELMSRPVILELDALNGDEKALLMMFILTFVYEYASANRPSGSPLSHVLVVEEAHNLIGRGGSTGSEFRADPKQHAIELFVQMLAEMRALGQGILIADQLPTALAPQAVKQTNLKVLMRMTAMDDRVEIGNTMDLDESHLKAVTRFKSGQAYAYLEDWDRVRQIQTDDFKTNHDLDVPPPDDQLAEMMADYELQKPDLYMPFPECTKGCQVCNRRVRNRAERFVGARSDPNRLDFIGGAGAGTGDGTACGIVLRAIKAETGRLKELYGDVDDIFSFCAYVHALNILQNAKNKARADIFAGCSRHDPHGDCICTHQGRDVIFKELLEKKAAN